MDIIESITGKLNINLGDMNNPNIIIEGIKVDNSEDSSEDDEDEEEEEDDEDEEEEEDDDEEEEEEDDEEENENNNQNNSQNNNESDNDDSNEENNEEDNNELQIFKLKKKKFILNLNEFQYKHIKKYSKNKEKKCSICLVKYQKPDILKEFPCNHIYHKNCILKWLEKSNICPLCKYDITNDVNKIELKNSNEEENNEEEDDEEEEEEEDDD
jgi:archaellum component FlaD/FlaE